MNEKHTDLLHDIEFTCKSLDFTWRNEVLVSGDWELNTFEFESNDINMFGFTQSIIYYEPNEWSSNPHDDYIIKITLFTDKKYRDYCYKQIQKNESFVK